MNRLAVSFIALGALLIAGAMSLLSYNRWDADRAAAASFEAVIALSAQIEQHEAMQPAPTVPAAPPEAEPLPPPSDAAEEPAPYTEQTVLIDGNNYLGILDIAELGITLPVMDTWSYPQLKTAPCRYSGSVADGNLVVAAHSYKRHFGEIGRLSVGSRVTFTDANGTEFRYTVEEVELLKPSDIERMTDSGYALTLFTCTYDSASRIAVRCERAEK